MLKNISEKERYWPDLCHESNEEGLSYKWVKVKADNERTNNYGTACRSSFYYQVTLWLSICKIEVPFNKPTL